MHVEKNILIVGGTGFVGQALVKYLLAKGYVVKILTRDTVRARKIFPELVAIHKWPSGNEKLLLGNNQACEAIVNLAGENIAGGAWSTKYKKKILDSRVHSIENIYEIVNRMPEKPRVWIQASAVGYYGYNTRQKVDESSPKGEGFLATVVDQLESTFSAVSLPATRKVVLRLGVVISVHGGFLHKLKQTFNWGLAVVPGSGEQKLSWIHIDDLTEIVHQAIVSKDLDGVINAVAPNPVSMNIFTVLLKKHSQAFVKFHVPAFILKMMLGKQKANELVLANQDVVPAKLLATNFGFRFQNFEDVFEK